MSGPYDCDRDKLLCPGRENALAEIERLRSEIEAGKELSAALIDAQHAKIKQSADEIERLHSQNADMLAACKKALAEIREPSSQWYVEEDLENAIAKAEG